MSPAWCGLTSVADRDSLGALLGDQHLGFRLLTATTLDTVFSEADDKLLAVITFNSSHLLHISCHPGATWTTR